MVGRGPGSPPRHLHAHRQEPHGIKTLSANLGESHLAASSPAARPHESGLPPLIGRPLLSETAPEAGPPGNESEEETVGWARRRSRRDGGLRQSGAPRRSSRPALARPPRPGGSGSGSARATPAAAEAPAARAAAEHSPACACANRRTRQPRVKRGPAALQTPGRGQERRAGCRRRARSSRATLGRRRRGPFRSRGRLHAAVR
mmetsp:Transcript_14971/g.48161  ORF Transcript_14971/g.48161 Transcript_14971/m.48161 type:complete len:203 (-) Transcript_14971:525-1133(-)